MITAMDKKGVRIICVKIYALYMVSVYRDGSIVCMYLYYDICIKQPIFLYTLCRRTAVMFTCHIWSFCALADPGGEFFEDNLYRR